MIITRFKRKRDSMTKNRFVRVIMIIYRFTLITIKTRVIRVISIIRKFA